MTVEISTESFELRTADGDMRCYEARPLDGARGAVVVIQEAFGVNDHIEDVTRRFAREGFHAVAPDLFHRGGGGTAEYGDWGRVIELFTGLSDETSLADVDAALDHLRGEGWNDDQLGIVGFCFGGRVTFLVAAHRDIGAAVGFYGGGIASQGALPFPPLIDRAPSLATPWLGLFGDDDESIPVESVEALRVALADTPLDGEVVRYPGVGHGFHCEARPDHFDPEAAHDAWRRTLAWFDRHLA